MANWMRSMIVASRQKIIKSIPQVAEIQVSDRVADQEVEIVKSDPDRKSVDRGLEIEEGKNNLSSLILLIQILISYLIFLLMKIGTMIDIQEIVQETVQETVQEIDTDIDKLSIVKDV